jgi:hypothetical protein
MMDGTIANGVLPVAPRVAPRGTDVAALGALLRLDPLCNHSKITMQISEPHSTSALPIQTVGDY